MVADKECVSVESQREAWLPPKAMRVAMAVVYAAPLLMVLLILAAGFAGGHFLLDFKGGLYNAGHDILNGHDPYRPDYLAHQAALQQAGHTPQTIIYLPVYPAPALVLAVPFSLLPYTLAGILFALVSIGAIVLALRLLGVTDWRCYGIAFASWPVQHGLMLGAMTPLLVLGVAVAWRYRDQALVCAAAVAAVVVAKLFLWPLLLWLLLTRRFRAAGLAIGLGVSSLVVCWAAMDFHGLTGYPRMLNDLSTISEGVGVSVVAALLKIGVAEQLARGTALAAGALLVASGARLVRRRAGEQRAFALAVLACLVASPMVWPHYLALLLVPIALVTPRLSVLWLVPSLSYIAPIDQTREKPWAMLPYLAMVGFLVALAMREPRAGGRGFPGAARLASALSGVKPDTTTP